MSFNRNANTGQFIQAMDRSQTDNNTVEIPPHVIHPIIKNQPSGDTINKPGLRMTETTNLITHRK